MKKHKHSEAQIIQAIKEYESGRRAEEISRELGINKATFYSWKSKYSGMDNQQLKKLKELEEENRKLKHMYADLALDNKMLKDVLTKKW
jgi:putative transposase